MELTKTKARLRFTTSSPHSPRGMQPQTCSLFFARREKFLATRQCFFHVNRRKTIRPFQNGVTQKLFSEKIVWCNSSKFTKKKLLSLRYFYKKTVTDTKKIRVITVHDVIGCLMLFLHFFYHSPCSVDGAP